eukprot:TRINITY_DN14524_c0_g1_i1.p1 TRINITY_DN14524_c0_g1~~TRINITY_DN14524_c0_g1_i1.p1  ORF type:complete len:371 (-),score=70.52 TRINITY_DN14524_c0_g1_i1:76-1188(-)
MLKAKDYVWSNSNLALFGTPLEKSIKAASAATEKAWHGVGTEEGLHVWRIHKFVPEKEDPKDHGKFFDGDSYIVLNVKKVGNEYDYDIHFWIGKHSSQDEYGTAAYKSMELDTLLDDKATQHREVQGHESKLFRKYFEFLEILEGGHASGFHHVKAKEYRPRLLQVKGSKRHVVIREVPLSCDSLDEDDSFILDIGERLIQWNGTHANHKEKMKALMFCQHLEGERGKCKNETIDEQYIDKDHEFYKLLGGFTKVVEHGSKKDEEVKTQLKLFRVSDHNLDHPEMKLEAEGDAVKRELFDQNDVFILDGGAEVICWIGKDVTRSERHHGIVYAHDYVKTTDHPLAPVSIAYAGTSHIEGRIDSILAHWLK